MERIKFTTFFPRDFHPDIVSAIEENENLCDWIHLPAQSGSDRILIADPDVEREVVADAGHACRVRQRPRADRHHPAARGAARSGDLIGGGAGVTKGIAAVLDEPRGWPGLLTRITIPTLGRKPASCLVILDEQMHRSTNGGDLARTQRMPRELRSD